MPTDYSKDAIASRIKAAMTLTPDPLRPAETIAEELAALHDRIDKLTVLTVAADVPTERLADFLRCLREEPGDKHDTDRVRQSLADLKKVAEASTKLSMKDKDWTDEEFEALEQAIQKLAPDWQAGCPPDIKKVLEAACVLTGEPLNRLMDEETGEPSTELPMQPIEMDSGGIIRFKGNGIVRYLLDAGPFDLNQIAVLPNITREEASQFAQLIGYSVSGYGDLSYAVRVEEADAISDGVVDANRCPGPVKSGHTCKLPAGHDGMHEVVAAKGVKRCRETHEFHECQLAHDHDGPHSESGNTWSSVATEPESHDDRLPKGYRWLKRTESLNKAALWFDEFPDDRPKDRKPLRQSGVVDLFYMDRAEMRTSHAARDKDWPSDAHGLCGIVVPY